MLAHLMPFVTEKPSGSRKVWRAEGPGGGSGNGGLRVPQRGSPTARGHRAGTGTAAPAPCPPAGRPSRNGHGLPPEQQRLGPSYQLIRPSGLLAPSDRQPQLGAPGTERQDGARWARRPGCSHGIKREPSGRSGRATTPRTWPEGQHPPGPRSEPPARSAPPALALLPPPLQKRRSALLGPVQPLAGRV